MGLFGFNPGCGFGGNEVKTAFCFGGKIGEWGEIIGLIITQY